MARKYKPRMRNPDKKPSPPDDHTAMKSPAYEGAVVIYDSGVDGKGVDGRWIQGEPIEIQEGL